MSPCITKEGMPPPKLAEEAYQSAQKGGISVVILDTAGRSQMDTELMNELSAIVRKVEIY